MQEQNLINFYRYIFTLKSGQQIQILTEVEIDFTKFATDTIQDAGRIFIDGFITTPMIIEKTINIRSSEVASIEQTKEPHLTWQNTELDQQRNG